MMPEREQIATAYELIEQRRSEAEDGGVVLSLEDLAALRDGLDSAVEYD